ncbi:MAG: 50S ribosomal protein L1 [Alphaproteobacteria bacterium]|nr:50S ribosomal protein L1 [Alphaproteobacteria bacterium]MCB9696111.1 50S ribosomal protein L1 [Alphaproteobacteria bacterium]
MAQGKRFRAVRELVDQGTRYGVDHGVELVKKTANAKFDESVDVAFRLGVNPRQADQMVRGALSLPHGSGKTVRVVVFAEGDAARAALEAGADEVGADELINKINDGWTDFDKAISVRNLMAKVGRLGRVLGPRGLMPNPKTGSVVGPEQVAEAVREVKAGRIDFKVEKAGIVHVSIGKASMKEEQLKDNLVALAQLLLRLKPATAKGTYVKSVALSTTMGPGVRLDANEVVRVASEAR